MVRKGYNRGGARQGTPGRAYAQRTDLNRNRQPVQAATGQPYGQRQAQQSAQRAVPLPAAPPVQAPPPAPGSLGAFNRPTEFPNEPITAGLAMGPGAGPEAMRTGVNPTGDVEAQLLALYKARPNNDILRLLRTARVRSTQTDFASMSTTPRDRTIVTPTYGDFHPYGDKLPLPDVGRGGGGGGAMGRSPLPADPLRQFLGNPRSRVGRGAQISQAGRVGTVNTPRGPTYNPGDDTERGA